MRGGGRGELARLLSVRALLLGVVLLIAFAMVFPTVRAYLAQRAMLGSLQAQVVAAEAREKQLRTDLGRWEVDAYVVAQARERLSYVMPGEKAYRVIDPQSVAEPAQVVGSTPGTEGGVALPIGGASAPWYATVWESVGLAGEAPVPGEQGAGQQSDDTASDGTAPDGTQPAPTPPTTPGAGG